MYLINKFRIVGKENKMRKIVSLLTAALLIIAMPIQVMAVEEQYKPVISETMPGLSLIHICLCLFVDGLCWLQAVWKLWEAKADLYQTVGTCGRYVRAEFSEPEVRHIFYRVGQQCVFKDSGGGPGIRGYILL